MRALYLLAAAALLPAQSLDRTKEPASPPLKDFQLPPTQDGTLPNGLKIVLVDDQRYPMIEVRLGFAAGGVYDPPSLSGVSEAVAALLTEGTANRSARQLAEELASLGAELGATKDAEFLILNGYTPSEHLGRYLDLVADVVLNANFPEDEIRRKKENRKQELLQARSDPDTLADEKLKQLLYGSHPYGRPLPTAESVDKITRADLTKFRDAMLAANNATLVMVGPFANTKPVWSMIETKFKTWAKRDVPKAPKLEAKDPAKGITLVDRPGSVQAAMVVGRNGIPRTDAAFYPLRVASEILGGGTASRLFDDVREKRGFAYNVGASHTPYRDGGLVEGHIQTRNDAAAPALSAVLEHFQKMGQERVSAKELSDIKNYLNGNTVMGLVRPAGVADRVLASRLNGVGNQYLESMVDNIRRVEPDQVQAAAKRFLDPAKMAVVVVGDAKEIGKALEKVAPVTVVK